MQYNTMKEALISVWSKLDRWEDKLKSLSINKMVETMNLVNKTLNSKVTEFPVTSNSLAKEGWTYMREIERLQKLNPAMADKIHNEVHYSK